MPEPTDIPEIYATVPVSLPVVVPEAEDEFMNGFAWSHEFGLLVGTGNQGEPARDELKKLRQPIETIRVNEQGVRGL